jgi:hypothetical protein
MNNNSLEIFFILMLRIEERKERKGRNFIQEIEWSDE